MRKVLDADRQATPLPPHSAAPNAGPCYLGEPSVVGIGDDFEQLLDFSSAAQLGSNLSVSVRQVPFDVSRQLKAMRGRLDEAGLRAPAVIIKSNGGEMTLEAASEAPVQMLLSGPTGGVIASRFVAEHLGIDRLVKGGRFRQRLRKLPS